MSGRHMGHEYSYRQQRWKVQNATLGRPYKSGGSREGSFSANIWQIWQAPVIPSSLTLRNRDEEQQVHTYSLLSSSTPLHSSNVPPPVCGVVVKTDKKGIQHLGDVLLTEGVVGRSFTGHTHTAADPKLTEEEIGLYFLNQNTHAFNVFFNTEMEPVQNLLHSINSLMRTYKYVSHSTSKNFRHLNSLNYQLTSSKNDTGTKYFFASSEKYILSHPTTAFTASRRASVYSVGTLAKFDMTVHREFST